MEKKKLIQIIIIVICFSAAGFIVYNGMFKGPPSASTTMNTPGVTNATPVGASNASAMPNRPTSNQNGKGNQITPVSIQQLSINYDFSKEIKKVLLKNGLFYQTFQYPKISESEVGVPVNDLLKPIPEQ
jgi:hypothetical protein